MKIVKFTYIFHRPIQILIGLVLSTNFASAQQVSMDINADPRIPGAHDWFIGTNAEYVTGPDVGESYLGGIVTLMCFNKRAFNPEVGTTHTYEIAVAANLFWQPSGLAGKGEAMVHWLLDTYYYDESYSDTWSFRCAIWEVAHDYDGTVDSMSLTTGVTSSTPGAGVVLDQLKTNYDSIPDTYRSTHYQVGYLTDTAQTPSGADYQGMLTLTPVPESSTIVFLGLVGMAATLRRKRLS